MTFLLELRTRFFRIVGKRERLSLAVVKFVLAIVAFSLITYNIGYMDAAGNPLLLAGLAVICAFTPIAFTLFFSVALILLNFYALALELCVIALLLFVLMFCLYFRFTKDSGYYTLLTPILCALRIPYVIPNAVGLNGKPYNIIAVICGTMTYFLLKNVRQNEALFRSFDESAEATSKFTLAANQLFVNKEMYIYMIAFIAASLVVYFVRKSSADHAWGMSVILGSVVQFVVVSGGMIAFGLGSKLLVVFLGSAAALILSGGLMFTIRTLDYSRVERIEFEDEDYYYYVKAVPKASIAIEEREVKQIASKKHKAVKGSGRAKKQVFQFKEAETATKEKQPEVRINTNGNGAEDELARKAMEEFDIDGDWLE